MSRSGRRGGGEAAPPRARWALRLGLAEAEAALDLRAHPAVQARVDDEWLWLRGDPAGPALMRRLQVLAGELFEVDRGGLLRRPGERLPCAELPHDGWGPLPERLPLSCPRIATPGRPPAPVTLRLERSVHPRAPGLLATTVEALVHHVNTASAHRLRPLRLAACTDGRALVRGEPLPPLPGRRYWISGAIATPCGWQWRPAVDPVAVATLIGLTPGEMALLEPGGVERLPAGAFVPLSRAAVRQTSAGLHAARESGSEEGIA